MCCTSLYSGPSWRRRGPRTVPVLVRVPVPWANCGRELSIWVQLSPIERTLNKLSKEPFCTRNGTCLPQSVKSLPQSVKCLCWISNVLLLYFECLSTRTGCVLMCRAIFALFGRENWALRESRWMQNRSMTVLQGGQALLHGLFRIALLPKVLQMPKGYRRCLLLYCTHLHSSLQ